MEKTNAVNPGQAQLYANSIKRVTFVFGGLMAYFLIAAAFSQHIRNFELEQEQKTAFLYEVALAARAFSEESHQTQLEIWEYAYEPNQERLDAFRGHETRLSELLGELKSHVQMHARLLTTGSLDQVKFVENSMIRIVEDWQKIIFAIESKKANHEVRRLVFAAEGFFDQSQFNKRVGMLIEEIKKASTKLHAETQSSRAILRSLELVEVVIGLCIVAFSLFYIRRLERQSLGQRQQLLSASKFAALGEMAGGIAHEINNPLAVIKSLSGQLQEVLDDEPMDRSLLKSMADEIEKTTDRIAKIVSGMRSFSRNGSQDGIRLFDLQKVIEETLGFCRERFKNASTKVEFEGLKRELLIEGRATEISQVVLNILNNAQDAIAQEKEKWIQIVVRELPEAVEIQITDCGKGIAPDIRDKIFQPFFTTKPIGQGTGLGLGISFGIIRTHGGTLSLDSQCANTRFVIHLPKKQQKISPKAA